MKKKILLLILITICLPVLVFAKDKPFYKKFQTDEIESFEEASIFTKTVELKDNFYTFSEKIEPDSENYPSLSMKKYDNKGNLIKENTIANAMIIDAITDDNYIYLFSSIIPTYPKILKLDSELNQVGSYTFTEQDGESLEDIEYYFLNLMIHNVDLMSIKNNYINIFLGNYILQFDLSLKNLQILNTNYSNIENLFPKIYKLGYFSAEIYDSNNNYQVYLEDYCQKSRGSSCGYTLKFLNNNETVLWSKNFDYYDYYADASVYINDVKIVNDYVVVLKTLDDGETIYTDIIIYSFNGDLVQEINNNGKYTIYNDILPTSLGFKVLKINNESNKCYSGRSVPAEVEEDGISPLAAANPCPYMQSEEFYYLYYFINSKVTGNGKIEYPDKAKAGEQVSFKTQADSNYTVKNVTVKDINGNTVNVNNGSFIMPEEDIIIEAEFVTLNNPYTKSGLIVLIGIIIISLGSYFVIKKKKLTN